MSRTEIKYTTLVILTVVFSIMFNVWLASGCTDGAGIITWHGKTCAFDTYSNHHGK